MRFVLGWFWLLGASALAHPLHPHLNGFSVSAVEGILNTPPARLRSESIEVSYQTWVQRQTFTDAAEIYDPRNESRLQISYASFTPDRDEEPGEDLGYGLSVVKRLELPLADGGVKVIEVNESWPEDRIHGGILNPDAVRIKTLAFEGPRHLPGSQRLYLYDLVHLSWNEDINVSLHRRSRFQGTRPSQMRVPVAAPGSCLKCHAEPLAGAYSKDFKRPGVNYDPESIVQSDYHSRPVEEMKGFQQYLLHLRQSKRSSAFVDRVILDLRNPKEATRVSALREALLAQAQHSDLDWVADDRSVPSYDRPPGISGQKGYYERDGQDFMSATEETYEAGGRYRYWFPQVRIPSGGSLGY